MKKNEFRLILLIFFILIFAFAISYLIFNDSNTPTFSNHEVIANNSAQDNGTVEVIKNVGNPNGKKIAYVVGVHPLENDTHNTFLKLMPTLDNLNYCYDIYVINVTEDFSRYGSLLPDDEPGRQTGQDLALKYVYPKIVNVTAT